jgi:hypothetical protein
MSEAIKLTPVTTAAGQTEGRADYKGCELAFSTDRSTLQIHKGDEVEVWRVGEFDYNDSAMLRHKAQYLNDTLGEDGLTAGWEDEDWEPIDAHAARYHIASNRELWREYFDPDENYTDEDWKNEPVADRVKTMESLAV